MKKIAFKNEKIKWILVFILLLLIAYNTYSLINGNLYAYLRITFQIILLLLIFMKNRYAKSLLEGVSFLYAILMSFNLLVIIVPLIIHLFNPTDIFENDIYISLIETSIKLILAVAVYKLSKAHLVVVTNKST